jgi:hypothetical protein
MTPRQEAEKIVEMFELVLCNQIEMIGNLTTIQSG